MQVKYKILREGAVLPVRSSAGAAGYDMCAVLETDELVIPPKQKAVIPTGIAMEIPHGYTVELYARSGLSVKRGLRLCNSVGLIDEDYRGEFKVALYNDSDEPQTIHSGDRIAQAVFRRYETIEFCEAEELTSTEREAGGFGSTGT